MIYARVAVPAPLKPLDRLLDYIVPEGLDVRPGMLVSVPFARRKTWAVVFELSDTTEVPAKSLKPIEALKLPFPVFDEARLKLLRWLSEHYFYPLGEVCETALPAGIREGTARTLKLPGEPATPSRRSSIAPPLNADQRAASEALRAAGAQSYLLWGVTGSGKTEVYLDAIAATLERERGAVVLVPEIALTPLLTERFEARFPGEVAVFHSSMRPAALRKTWLETALGFRRIAVGARSGLFAPVQNPGMIIVDEEHDGSYKQEDRLKYHARDAALELGRLAQIPVVLGSATPSAESLSACRENQMTPLRLEQRAVGQARLPELQIVDLKKQISAENKAPVLPENDEGSADFPIPSVHGDFFLTPELRFAIDETLAQGKQAILFLNRRGLASQELCRSCGHTLACPSCDIPLTSHAKGLLCHYCGYTQHLPETCPSCAKGDFPYVRVGVGTAAIDDAVRFHFPKARTLRLDRDTAESPGAMEDILSAFGSGAGDILIGTQMVAKGHDFPDVTLVGILLADIGLGVPDFRSNERSLQLLLQVAGRAGRAEHPGRVILQTFQPDHPVFRTLLSYKRLDDYGDFLALENESRKELLYPPHAHLAVLRFDGLDLGSVSTAAHRVARALSRLNPTDLRVLGPVPSPLARLRNRYRWQILLKTADRAKLSKALTWIFDGWEQKKMEQELKTRMVVDVDPLSMM